MSEPKILVVDDEQLILDSLARDLASEGYHVSCTDNGRDAIKLLENEYQDLVITDLMMPEMDGIELLKETKLVSPETNVIIFTGYGDMTSAIDALRLGADDYLLKPCDTEELLFRVSRCFEKQDLTQQLQVQNHKLQKEIAGRQQLEKDLIEQTEKIMLFSYSIAHDIKAPTICIHGLIKLFIKKFSRLLPEKGRRYCTQILRSAEHIMSLVDQINLYLSAKESPLTIESVPLKELTNTIREEFSIQLNARQIKWIEPAELPVIRGDGMALLRVLRNCIDNALKYGGETLRKVTIQYKQTPQFHILSVENDGTSITKDECETVFELFRREKSSQGVQGTGLGLAIVKEIIERHKGEVWAEPGKPKGIVFHMSIARGL